MSAVRAPTAGSAIPSAVGLVREAANVFAGLGRDDLVRRLHVAEVRIQRPTTVVCVVGEFKQGKSSLVNALLGGPACPVDDDLATSALTVVHYSDPPRVVVHRRQESEVVKEEVDSAALAEWVTEQGNPGNVRTVERVDIGLPHPFLREGLSLVDTPGMGAIGADRAAATLAFLPYADGLVFVTDATAELSGPEVEFLRRARAACPTVVCALTKIDLVPHWRRVAELNQRHLSTAGIDVPVLPVSAVLRLLAVHRRDGALDSESGVPALARLLADQIVARAKDVAGQRAARDVRAATLEIGPSLETELAMLEDPARIAAGTAGLEAARAKLEQLRGPGARWVQVLGDRMADLNSRTSYSLRGSLRALQRESEARLEELKTPADWDDLGRDVRTTAAEAVSRVFAELQEGAQRVEDDVRGLLAEEALDFGELTSLKRQFDITTLWTEVRIDEGGVGAGRAAGMAVTGLRGAQGGIFMVSIFARFLPAGLAGVLLAAPVSLGLGAVFAGQQLLDANRRKLAARRQKAKLAVGRFLDDVQFEVGTHLADSVRELQRELRDTLSARIAEMQRGYADALARAQQDAARGEHERAARAADVRRQLEAVRQLGERALALEAGS